jgi:hypothetical protein
MRFHSPKMALVRYVYVFGVPRVVWHSAAVRFGTATESHLRVALLGLSLIGCSSAIEIPPGDWSGSSTATPALGDPALASVAPTAGCSATGLVQTQVRRLSHVEYNRTVRALFPTLDLPLQEFSDDLRVHGFENNADALNPSPMLLEQYSAAASRIAELAAAAPDVVPCATVSADWECGRAFIAQFGRRAFRRPLTSDEQARYEALFAQHMTEISFSAALELTLEAFLQSPQFLYRLELGGPGEIPNQPVWLDGYAMASRLSYLLWQSMPDDELLAAAERGELATAAGVESQARRMLQAQAASDALVDFHRQWLGFDHVLDENKDPELYSTWNDALREAMREESNRFVAHVVSAGSGTVAELLTSTVSFVNPELAALYGVSIASGDWQFVNLPAEQRAGILTRANFLAGEAHSTNGSPPLRGVAVLDRLLCSRPPAPPANIDATAPVSDPNMLRTNRQLFEERSSVAQCQGCHKSINGIGFGFESYDSIGAYRTVDQGMNVDARGELVGTDVDGPYTGAVELSAKLALSEQVQNCAAKNWYRYAFARTDDATDACMLQSVYEAMERSGGDMRALLIDIATSYPFTHRAAITP